VRKRKCVYEREKEVHGSGGCVSLLRLVCVSFGFLVLVGGLWHFLPIVFYCIAFHGSWGGVEEIFPGSFGVFFSLSLGRSIHESYEFTGFLLGSIPLAVGCPFIRLWERTTKRNGKQ
jgi:hypothetical protein